MRKITGQGVQTLFTLIQCLKNYDKSLWLFEDEEGKKDFLQSPHS